MKNRKFLAAGIAFSLLLQSTAHPIVAKQVQETDYDAVSGGVTKTTESTLNLTTQNQLTLEEGVELITGTYDDQKGMKFDIEAKYHVEDKRFYGTITKVYAIGGTGNNVELPWSVYIGDDRVILDTIGEGAFDENTEINAGLTIPTGIKTIKSGAFKDCVFPSLSMEYSSSYTKTDADTGERKLYIGVIETEAFSNVKILDNTFSFGGGKEIQEGALNFVVNKASNGVSEGELDNLFHLDVNIGSDGYTVLKEGFFNIPDTSLKVDLRTNGAHNAGVFVHVEGESFRNKNIVDFRIGRYQDLSVDSDYVCADNENLEIISIESPPTKKTSILDEEQQGLSKYFFHNTKGGPLNLKVLDLRNLYDYGLGEGTFHSRDEGEMTIDHLVIGDETDRMGENLFNSDVKMGTVHIHNDLVYQKDEEGKMIPIFPEKAEVSVEDYLYIKSDLFINKNNHTIKNEDLLIGMLQTFSDVQYLHMPGVVGTEHLLQQYLPNLKQVITTQALPSDYENTEHYVEELDIIFNEHILSNVMTVEKGIDEYSRRIIFDLKSPKLYLNAPPFGDESVSKGELTVEENLETEFKVTENGVHQLDEFEQKSMYVYLEDTYGFNYDTDSSWRDEYIADAYKTSYEITITDIGKPYASTEVTNLLKQTYTQEELVEALKLKLYTEEFSNGDENVEVHISEEVLQGIPNFEGDEAYNIQINLRNAQTGVENTFEYAVKLVEPALPTLPEGEGEVGDIPAEPTLPTLPEEEGQVGDIPGEPELPTLPEEEGQVEDIPGEPVLPTLPEEEGQVEDIPGEPALPTLPEEEGQVGDIPEEPSVDDDTDEERPPSSEDNAPRPPSSGDNAEDNNGDGEQEDEEDDTEQEDESEQENETGQEDETEQGNNTNNDYWNKGSTGNVVIDEFIDQFGLGTEAFQNYINGYEDGTFKPNGKITRGEFIHMISNILLNGGQAPGGNGVFLDIEGDYFATNAINFLAQAQIVEGYGDGTFRPHQAITRAEVATILARLNTGMSAESSVEYADLEQTYWAYEDIQRISQQGWMIGYEDNTFKAGNDITRAETVVALNRIYRADYPFDATMYELPFTDVESTHWAYEDILKAAVVHTASVEEIDLTN